MKFITTILLFLFSLSAFGQANILGSGNWDDVTRWTSGNIGDDISENVTMDNNQDITVRNTFTYTIGNFTLGNSEILTIEAGGRLNIGQPGNTRLFTIPNGLNLTVNGDFYVYGDMDITNNINISVTGTFVVTGNIIANNNSSISVTSGSISVGGNVTAGNNTSISLTSPGGMNIAGNLTVGVGSTLGGNGILQIGGTCSGPICGDPQLPVELIFFNGMSENHSIRIAWATLSELNFDYFEIQKSTDGKNFSNYAKIVGHGNTKKRHDYFFVDEKPVLGKNYYRLKTIDFDGYTEEFDIVLVNFTGENSFAILPNPSEGTSFTTQLNFLPHEESILSIYDNLGHELMRQTLNEQQTEITLSNKLASGIYYAKFMSRSFNKTIRIVVR